MLVCPSVYADVLYNTSGLYYASSWIYYRMGLEVCQAPFVYILVQSYSEVNLKTLVLKW